VWNTEQIQPFRPFVEVFSTIDQELQVIETRLELAETLAGVLRMTDETEHELALRLNESHIVPPLVLTCEVVEHVLAHQL